MGDVWLDITTRMARSALTALGTLIGIAVLVSTLGLAKSVSARIVTRFDALAATEVTVKAVDGGQAGAALLGMSSPGPIPQRAHPAGRHRAGPASSSTFSEAKTVRRIRGTPVIHLTAGMANVNVIATSSQLPQTVHAIVTGRFFDGFHDQRGEAVAVLGAAAARQLNVSAVDDQPAIFLDDRPVVVVGIITATGRKPELLNAIVVPDGLARAMFGLASPQEVLVDTRIGAAEVVGRQAPFALRPDAPASLQVVIPPTPTLTRDRVSDDTNALFLVLAGISLLIGGVGIANVTLVSVLERVPEIGLRRALGARRSDLVGHFLIESTALGFLGALAGTAVGVITTVAIAELRGWPPTMHPWLPLVAPLLGGLIGLASGAYPAIRAGRVEPIEALRAA